MRISEKQRFDIANQRLDQSRSGNAAALEDMATHKQVRKISDEPVAINRILRTRSDIKNLQQFQRNVDFSRGFLERSESAIAFISDNLIRAKELAVAMSNATYDEQSKQATAQEIKQIRQEIVGLGNTTYANRYVFSGFRIKTPALSDDGHFLGDDGAIFLQLDKNDHRQINLQARNLFEAAEDEKAKGHCNLVESMDMLYNSLNNNDVFTLRKIIDELDFQLEKTTSYRAKLGALYSALDAATKNLEVQEEHGRGYLSQMEDVDIFKASADLKRTESILQGTMMASSKMLPPSLLNYMQ